MVFNSARAEEQVFDLTVVVYGVEPNVGQVITSLFNSEDSYLNEPLDEIAIPVEDQSHTSATFSGLAAGEYAVSIFYDEDMDGELDTGLFRIPKERIGFSNDAKARMGPAPYEKAKFILNESNKNITITLERAD